MPFPASITLHCGIWDYKDASRILRFHHARRRLLLPVYADVWLRLLFRALAVNDRLSFLARNTADAVLCPQRGCHAPETYVHLFLECEPARQIWRCVWDDWSQLLTYDLTWASLIDNPRRPSTQDTPEWWPAMLDLWYAFRAITIRHLWIDRNAIIFKSAESTSTTTLLFEIYGCFAAHVRRIRRQAEKDDLQLYDQVLEILLQSSSLGQFFFTRRYLLAPRAKICGIFRRR